MQSRNLFESHVFSGLFYRAKYCFTLFMTARNLFAIAVLVFLPPAFAEEYEIQPEVLQQEVDSWNKFTASLLTLHSRLVAKVPHRMSTGPDRYAGEYAKNYRFTNEKFYTKKDGKLISHIRWHSKSKKEIHTIEVFIYNRDGKLVRDYAAAFLPYARNAPFQTLINIHEYNGTLHAFRQFDANGEVLFEKCEGQYKGKPVSLALEDYEIPDSPLDSTPAYIACFGKLPRTAGKYLNPLSEIQ
jgi:hypothetical protein